MQNWRQLLDEDYDDQIQKVERIKKSPKRMDDDRKIDKKRIVYEDK
jgi:hypothetical protein